MHKRRAPEVPLAGGSGTRAGGFAAISETERTITASTTVSTRQVTHITTTKTRVR
jgi:hypothetical protein